MENMGARSGRQPGRDHLSFGDGSSGPPLAVVNTGLDSRLIPTADWRWTTRWP
jgi:hypothetical protein